MTRRTNIVCVLIQNFWTYLEQSWKIHLIWFDLNRTNSFEWHLKYCLSIAHSFTLSLFQMAKTGSLFKESHINYKLCSSWMGRTNVNNEFPVDNCFKANATWGSWMIIAENLLNVSWSFAQDICVCVCIERIVSTQFLKMLCMKSNEMRHFECLFNCRWLSHFVSE